MNFMRRFALLGVAVCMVIGIVIVDAEGTTASTIANTATLQLPNTYSFSAISGQISLPTIGIFGRSRKNSKRCVVATVQAQIPPSLRLVKVTSTSCAQPDGSTRVIPFYDSLNGDTNASTVHVLSLNSKTNQVVIGPTLMTYTELSDVQVETTSTAGSLWIYLCKTTAGSQLLRISTVNGTVLNTIPMPSICRTVVSSTAEGFSMRPSFNTDWSENSILGIYDVAPGSNEAVLTQRCSSKPVHTC